MKLDPSVCYRAVQARDVRWDGRFFTCVKTTGIYCRPICPARPPRIENCTFVPTAAAAQEAGFRPCLRCRPESSPDLDAWRGTSATVSRALKMIETGALDESDVAALAERLEVGERHLRRLFRRHIGAAPVTVAQTRRVLLAKQLIHQTNLPMIDVAMASGFGSVRRFNETFLDLYRRPPSELRKRPAVAASSPEISLLLPYRPPYDWTAMLRFLEVRAVAGLEVVRDESYNRVITLGDATGSIRVHDEPQATSLRVAVRFPRLDALPAIIARVRRMFDLSAEPGAVGSVLGDDPWLAPLVKARPGLRLPGAWCGFELAVRAILGQQITVSAATALAGKIVATLGEPLPADGVVPGLTHAFPRPQYLAAPVLAKSGMPRARAESLARLAEATLADPHLFDPRRDLAEAAAHLRKLPGVGEWTAQYIAMRALGESDAFLADDVALRRKCAERGLALNASQLRLHSERWRPWRAYAVFHLWMADAIVTRTHPEK